LYFFLHTTHAQQVHQVWINAFMHFNFENKPNSRLDRE